MSLYHVALLVVAVIVAAISYKTPRAILWICVLAGSFVLSVSYLNGYQAIEVGNVLGAYVGESEDFVPLEREWLPPSLIAAASDAVAAAIIFAFGRERWETLWLYWMVLGMMAVNLIYSSGVILGFPPVPDQDTLGAILEAINYAALLLIGGTGILDRVRNGNGGFRGALGRVLDTGRSYLHTPARRSLWPKQ
jgi:hypothetical protein